jgi:hypothetical protein
VAFSIHGDGDRFPRFLCDGNHDGPLNGLAGTDAAQIFTLAIDKTANAGVDFAGVADVLLGVGYTATF